MNRVNVKHAGLAIYSELLSVLIAENTTFVKGQPIRAIDDVTGTLKSGLKFGEWDIDNLQPIESAPKFTELDWFVKPEAAGAGGFTPFIVTTADHDQPKYEVVGNDTVITDTRFVGSNIPIVSSTAVGVDFRRSNLQFDPALGKLTILGFNGMTDDDHISVFLPAAIVTSDDVAILIERINKLELYTKPIALGGSVYIWRRPRVDIPAEYQEVTDLAGKFVVGYLAGDADFGVIGATGGAKSHKINSANNLSKFSLFTIVDQVLGPIAGHPSDAGRAVSSLRSLIKAFSKSDGGGKESYDAAGSDTDNLQPTLSPTSSIGKADPDPISHLNPYVVVDFIELKPEYRIA